MFSPAAIRRKLAFAALAAIVVPTFLPALHAIPGLGHDDCCGVHGSHGHAVHAGDATCGHDHSARECCEHSASTCRISLAQCDADTASPGWSRRESGQHACLLCDLFADFLLPEPEGGFVVPEIDAIESLTAPAAARVEVSARGASCRGPPVAV